MSRKRKIGMLGGGQLGRMFIEAGNRLDVQVNVLDVGPHGSAKRLANHDGHIDGSFKDQRAIQELAKTCDVITIEIEHVDTHVLESIATSVDIQPSWKTIRTIQDKYAQKQVLINAGVATAKSVEVKSTTEGLEEAAEHLGLPFMLKAKTDAYDGRGNYPVKTIADYVPALEALKGRPLYAERWSNFKMELAVMIVKTKDDVLAFPVVETVHEDSICKLVYAPARNVACKIRKAAQDLAKKAVASFDGKGVFGVEMFLQQDDSLLINEIAPRPHNSGHYTIEACPMSQYEAHLRSVLDIRIPPQALEQVEPAIMLNILGGKEPDSHEQIARLAEEGEDYVSIHLYDKGTSRPGRKMGHLTVTAPSMSECERKIAPLLRAVDEQRAARIGLSPPTAQPPESSSAHAKASTAKVAVTMGSHSDLPVLAPGLRLLEELQVPFTTNITSAHRTPQHMADFAMSMPQTHPQVEVIIGAAGGAAHLPGMLASHTVLPVIGVPVKPSIGDGMDSLVSMTNMPRGVPVATVGINNSINAALLAARQIAVHDAGLQERLTAWIEKNEKASLEKHEALVNGEWEPLMKEWSSK